MEDHVVKDVRTALVLGATGATGKWVVRQLLSQGVKVRAIVSSLERLEGDVRQQANFEAVEGSVLAMGEADLKKVTAGCDAVVSCLGHRMTLSGLFGHPRKLVRDSCKRVCESFPLGEKTKFVLMCSDGVNHPDGSDKASRSFGERSIQTLLRHILPPHRDNELAAEYFYRSKNPNLEWCVVRPGTLVNDDKVTSYETSKSILVPMLGGSKTISRINVADFMSKLVIEDDLWAQWRGQMPFAI